jgi:acyl-CoA thioesterase FadM
MNLLIRLLYVLILAMFRPRLPAGKARSVLRLVTLPNDLDLNFHMNNGRYLTLCDLSRVDMFLRTGLVRLMWQRHWAPLIAEHTMVYKSGLRLFDKFELTADITHWDEKYFYMAHRFERRGKLVAEGTSKGVIRGREGVIAPEQVLAALLAQGARRDAGP